MVDIVEDSLKETTEKEDLWATILGDVSLSSAKIRSATPKNILVLGDVCSGKSTLIDRLCQISPSKGRRSHSSQGKFLLSGCSLEYRFINVQDEDTDDFLARMGVWNLDGVVWHRDLLPFVLQEKTIHDTLVMIVVDLSQPWNVLESLERWTEVVSKHVNSLKISEKQRKAMEEKMVKVFQSYQDPEDQSISGGVSGGDGEDVILPLDDNILTCNLGVPLIVVCTKSDSFSQLEKNHNYKDEHFDFIQQHIRKFCLTYGAALVYSSTKDNKNIDVLHKYLIHRGYGLRFNVSASIVERDAVFIPCGWDNDKRIAVLCDQMKHISPREPLKNIIIPPRATVPSSDVEGVSGEDDQVFLLAQQAHLSKMPKAPTGTGTGSTISTIKEKSPRPSLQTPEPLDTSKQGAGGGGGERVLADFFNSLLTKNKPVSKTGIKMAATAELEELQNK